MDPWIDWTSPSLEDLGPLTLASETNRTATGWEINFVVLLDQNESGYLATTPIWTSRAPFVRDDQSDQAARQAAQAATTEFAARLRQLMMP